MPRCYQSNSCWRTYYLGQESARQKCQIKRHRRKRPRREMPMPASYHACMPGQNMLLLHSMPEWLSGGRLAYFISDTVDRLDLQAFHSRCRRRLAQSALLPRHDGQVAALWLRHRRLQLTQARPQAAPRHRVLPAGGRQLPGALHADRLSGVSPAGVRPMMARFLSLGRVTLRSCPTTLKRRSRHLEPPR